MQLKDRIVELVRVTSDELVENEGNWRVHTQAQKNAFRGIVSEIGVADALLAYRSERNGGKLVLVDGHMRKSEYPDTKWPVLILDLTDEEADLLLQAHDPVAAMAQADLSILADLRRKAEFQDASVRVMLDSIDGSGLNNDATAEAAAATASGSGSVGAAPKEEMIPEMELQPYEHYDYVLVLARNVMDWNWLVEKLGLSKVDGSPDPRYKKVGLGRAITADKLIAALQKTEALEAENQALRSQLQRKAS